MYQLSNAQLTARFNAQGAELCSLKNANGVEYIWEANPDVWGRHAPVLFPIVGKVKQNTYRVNNKEFQLSQHGFARDCKFEVIEQTAQRITFQLASNETTLTKYPYVFVFRIIYELIADTLEINYEVENTGNQRMFFSIGAHPGFACPIGGEGVRSDYSLVFSKVEDNAKHLIKDGLFTGEQEKMLQDTNKLPLSDSLFDQDALVFKSLKSTTISIVNKSDVKKLSVHFAGFPYMGIWSKSRTSPFVCIEPWFGMADHIDFNGDISEKEGIQVLESGKQFQCQHSIQIH